MSPFACLKWGCCAVADATEKQQSEAEEDSGAAAGGEQQYLDEVLQSMSSDDESSLSPSTSVAPGEAPPASEAERQLLIQAQYAAVAVRALVGLDNTVLACADVDLLDV